MNRREFIKKATLDTTLLASAPLILSSGKKAFGSDLESRTKIAFSFINRDGKYNIYTINPDGSNLKRLTNNNSSDIGPAWSPFGTKIAFTHIESIFESEIYVMDADGSDQTRLTNKVNGMSSGGPSWSPDGKKIAYSNNNEILIMNSDGTNQTYLTDGFSPAWSPYIIETSVNEEKQPTEFSLSQNHPNPFNEATTIK